jgi:hypothetical protein
MSTRRSGLIPSTDLHGPPPPEDFISEFLQALREHVFDWLKTPCLSFDPSRDLAHLAGAISLVRFRVKGNGWIRVGSAGITARHGETLTLRLRAGGKRTITIRNIAGSYRLDVDLSPRIDLTAQIPPIRPQPLSPIFDRSLGAPRLTPGELTPTLTHFIHGSSNLVPDLQLERLRCSVATDILRPTDPGTSSGRSS